MSDTRADSPPLRTAVLVLNFNGRHHLDDCLSSLAALDVFAPGRPGVPREGGPRDEVWLVDNASDDGSVDFVRERFPWVRLAVNESNLGFPLAYNRVVEACPAEFVAFLNNDTRVRPDWLTRLHAVRDRHPRAAAVASRILSWDGSAVDFEGADTFFFGHALQHEVGASAGNPPPERPLLFGCAGSLLFHRRTFLEIGGFDPDYFSFSEDVDLGWRASLLGHETWFAPDAVTLHRLHASWGPSINPRSRYLLERNALANVYKNWADERMGVVFLASVALAFLRGAWAGMHDVPAPPPFVFTDTLAHHLALADLARLRPALAERRARIQGARQRRDEELLPLFGALTRPPLPGQPAYRAAFAQVCATLGLAGSPLALGAWEPTMTRAAEQAAWGLAELCGATLLPAFPGRSFVEHQVSLATQHPVPPAIADVLWQARQAVEAFLADPLTEAAVVVLAEKLRGLTPDGMPARPDEPPAGRFLSAPRAVTERPPVTVVVRTRNRLDVLGRALDSLAAQTRRPDEVLVIDDGTSDPTEVIRGFAGPLAIRLLRNMRPLGRSGAAQRGLAEGRGALVGFLDDDDTLEPHHLEILTRALAERGARVAFADVECVVEEASGRPISRSFFHAGFDPSRLHFENTIPIMAVLTDRALALEVGGFDPALEYFEDWDLWLRLARRTPFVHCPVVTATYHVRPAAGHGTATAGEHRYAHMRTLLEKHRAVLTSDDVLTFYRTYVEPLRHSLREAEWAARRSRAEAASIGHRLDTLERSLPFRVYRHLRRLLGRT